VESLEEVSLEEASLEEVSLEVASLEEVSLGRAIHSEYCGMARSVLRTDEMSRLICCTPLA
jgi:hypothetical protein